MKKTTILLGLSLLLAGCQTRAIKEIRVVGDVGLGIPGAMVSVDTIYSGFPYPAPSFLSDENGKITLPNAIQLNGGSYVTVVTSKSTQYFTRKELVVDRRKSLVLRLNESRSVDVQAKPDFDARITAPSLRINED